MSDSASFGEWVRRRRRALDLTRQALARQVGCAVVTIRKIETDERRPSRELAERLAEYLLIPATDRAAFVQAARAQLAVDRLAHAPVVAGPIPSGSAVVATVHSDPSTTPQGERRWVTVLFFSIAAARSEHLDIEDAQAVIMRYMEHIDIQIRHFGGALIPVMTDTVLAVFGAPLTREDDAVRAVHAALMLRDSLRQVDPSHPLDLHIGVNTGEVLATFDGPLERRALTVAGDTIHIANQLLHAAGSGSVLVGNETYRATRHVVRYRAHSPAPDSGKQQPSPVWEAVSATMIPETRPLGTAPLVGRDEELALLEVLWARVAREAEPHLAMLVGEPGIGKSRLVAEFERRLPSNVAIWHGRCLPYGQALGYGALTMALKEASGISAEDDGATARRKLDDLVAGVLEPDENPSDVAQHLALLSGLDQEVDRRNRGGDQRVLHASARRFLEAFARRRPLCLILEDLHWADAAFLEMVEAIAARVRGARLLIIMQTRPELLEQRPAWGRGVRSFTSLPLSALTEAAEYALVQALCQERGLPIEHVAAVGRRSGGNPLFVEELVAMIAESGRATGVPALIKTLIAARMDALPAEERATLQRAAIYGKVFWKSGLRALDDDAVEPIDYPLDTLQEKDWLRELSRSQFRGDREYMFKHDLIRDVAYEMLPRAARRARHGRAADWMERAAGGQLERYCDQLAHHAISAGQPERAIDYLVRAAERAGHAAAHRQAAGLLAQAIAIAEDMGEHPLLADMHARRGKAFVNVSMWADARPDLEGALAGLPPTHMEQRALVLIDLATVAFWLPDMAGLRRYAQEAMALANALNRDDIVAGAIAVLTLAHSSEGESQAVVSMAEESLSRAGDQPIPAVTFGVAIRSLNYLWLGRFGEAVTSGQQAVQVARQMNDTQFTSYALPHVGLALAAQGNFTDAQAVFDEARRFSREYEIWPMLARVFAMEAGYHLDVFDYSGHTAIAEEACELARSVKAMNPLVSASLDLLFNAIRCQDVGRAEQIVNEVGETVERAAGQHGWLWRLRLAEARAELALARGDAEEALRLVEYAIAASRARGRVKYHAFGLETRSRALAAIGRKHDAIADARHAVNLVRTIEAPALFLRAAATFLEIEGNDTLLAEARVAADSIAASLPHDDVRLRFWAAEPVQRLGSRAASPA